MEKRISIMENLDSPRLRTKEEILQQADYYLDKFIRIYWDELLFKDDDLQNLLTASKILEIKMEQQNAKSQIKART